MSRQKDAFEETWFHRDFRRDDWLLYSCGSPGAQRGHGLSRGSIYDRQGRLVASTAQEGVIRVGYRRETG